MNELTFLMIYEPNFITILILAIGNICFVHGAQLNLFTISIFFTHNIL